MGKKRLNSKETERKGINFIEQVIIDMGWIWREQPIEDFGIDGHIEICTRGSPTGKLIGVQIKTGLSYIRQETDNSFVYRCDKDDLSYWEKHCLPVILVIVKPNAPVEAYYYDISEHDGSTKNIEISKKMIFSVYCKSKLIEIVSKQENRVEKFYLSLLPLVLKDNSILNRLARNIDCRMKLIIIPSIRTTETVFEELEKDRWKFLQSTITSGFIPERYFLKNRFPYFDMKLLETQNKSFSRSNLRESLEESMHEVGVFLTSMSSQKSEEQQLQFDYELRIFKLFLNSLGEKLAKAFQKNIRVP